MSAAVLPKWLVIFFLATETELARILLEIKIYHIAMISLSKNAGYPELEAIAEELFITDSEMSDFRNSVLVHPLASHLNALVSEFMLNLRNPSEQNAAFAEKVYSFCVKIDKLNESESFWEFCGQIMRHLFVQVWRIYRAGNPRLLKEIKKSIQDARTVKNKADTEKFVAWLNLDAIENAFREDIESVSNTPQKWFQWEAGSEVLKAISGFLKEEGIIISESQFIEAFTSEGKKVVTVLCNKGCAMLLAVLVDWMHGEKWFVVRPAKPGRAPYFEIAQVLFQTHDNTPLHKRLSNLLNEFKENHAKSRDCRIVFEKLSQKCKEEFPDAFLKKHSKKPK